jgi:hypothetical protein
VQVRSSRVPQVTESSTIVARTGARDSYGALGHAEVASRVRNRLSPVVALEEDGTVLLRQLGKRLRHHPRQHPVDVVVTVPGLGDLGDGDLGLGGAV